MSNKNIHTIWLNNHRRFTRSIRLFLENKDNTNTRFTYYNWLRNYLNRIERAITKNTALLDTTSKKEPSKFMKFLKHLFFLFLVLCGIIHAVSAAFDGVNAILTIFGLSNMVISVSCTILGIFGIVLFFSYEITRLARGLGLENFISIPSPAKDLLVLQNKVTSISSKLEARMQESMLKNDLKSYQNYRTVYCEFFKQLKPLHDEIEIMKVRKDTVVRKIIKGFFAIIAGLLSGAVAFFDGQSLLGVITKLLSIKVTGSLLFWVPVSIGSLCFVVIMMVALFSEGRGIIRLIDALQRRPYDIIQNKLQTKEWDIAPYQKSLMTIAIEEDSVKPPRKKQVENLYMFRRIKSESTISIQIEEEYSLTI